MSYWIPKFNSEHFQIYSKIDLQVADDRGLFARILNGKPFGFECFP